MMEKEGETQKPVHRRQDIDILRGIGIALMVIGHFELSYGVEKVMYAFHMPLFFLVSGYLYKKPDDFCSYVKKKMKGFLQPYFAFAIGLMMFKLLFMEAKLERLQDSLKAMLWMPTMNVSLARSLWFLMAMFWCVVIYAWLDLKCQERLKTILVIALVCLFCSWRKLFPLLPWAICNGLCALGFYHIGHLYRQYEEAVCSWVKRVTAKKPLLILLVLLLVVVTIGDYHLIMHSVQLSLRKVRWGNIPLAYFHATYLTILVYLLALLCERRILFLGKLFAFFGHHSILYLGLNELAIKMSKNVAALLLPATMPLPRLLIAYAVAMALMSICVAIVLWHKKHTASLS